MNIQNQIAQLESIMQGIEHSCESDVSHYQIEGVYVRSMFIPAGQVVIGMVHNHEHIGILAQGTMRICGDGEEPREITAPYIVVAPAGIKRAVVTLTDCTFINVIRTDLTEIADIEKEAVSETFEEFEERKRLCHSRQFQQV